ncbi:GMC family oxidoreductase [Halioxenophilus aromaticivorans]
MSGGWAAKELTEKNFKTLVIERGPETVHGKDYPHDFSNPWDLEHRGIMDEKLLERDYFVQRRCFGMNEYNRSHFVNDRLNPYIEEKPFNWIRGYHTGGRSVMWGRQSYRLSNLDFEANKRDGHGTDWPIRYEDLSQWYDYVEDFVGVSGSTEHIEHLPDGVFLPPMEMNCAEKAIKQRLEKQYADRKLIIGRIANLTKPKPHHIELGRGPCQFRNQCSRGCSFGAYFSSLTATLPAAKRTGNLSMAHNSIVKEILYDTETGRASGVRVIDSETLQEREYRARIIFLCASTIGSAQILLNSKSTAFPNGLANSSGVVGHYLTDHLMVGGATGVLPGYEDQYYTGRRANGIYIPRFVNMGDNNQDYLRGFGYQGAASRSNWGGQKATPGIGVDLKKKLHDPGPWKFTIIGFGEMLPRYDNCITLDEERRDPYGLPLVKINVSWSDNESKMRESIISNAVDMLVKSGLEDVKPVEWDTTPGTAIHEMGTARMGLDAKTSVLNGFNQCHDVPNLFVTDGAAMASSTCHSPSLTYMAMTARAVDYAVRQDKANLL